jgi:hypothetical protein
LFGYELVPETVVSVVPSFLGDFNIADLCHDLTVIVFVVTFKQCATRDPHRHEHGGGNQTTKISYSFEHRYTIV